MPATRHTRTRTDKVDELVAAAQRLFVERGYEATTIGAVAAEVGIASNVLYWYFPSKDHLFVAALDKVLREELVPVANPPDPIDLEEALPRVVRRLVGARHLIAAVHQRAPASPVVATFHDHTHRLYETLLSQALAPRCPDPAERHLATEALITTMEGLVLHGAGPAKARRTLRFLLARLAPPPPPSMRSSRRR